MTKFTRLALPALAFLTPLAAAAQSAGTVGGKIQGLIDFGNKYVIPLIFAVAFIVFLWGVFQYFIAGGANDEQRQKGRQFILWSVIGFFLMFSLWGIVSLFYHSAGFENTNRPGLPTFDRTGSSGVSNSSDSNSDWNGGQPVTP